MGRNRESGGIYRRESERSSRETRRVIEMRRKRIYVPDSATLWEEIIMRHHNSKLAQYLGYTKIHKLITRNY